MELSEKQLNKVYEKNDRLGVFLDNCAIGIFSHNWMVTDPSVNDLPDQEIIDLVDWWKKKQSEQKYTVKVGPGNYGYLVVNFDDDDFDISILGLVDHQKWQSKFTKQEIEELKNRDDLAIDWDKAIIETVEEESNG